MRIRNLPLAVVLLVAVHGSAFADTIVVPNDQPTLQEAVDAAADGDTIVVKKNTYSENVVLDGKNNITIRGAGKPVIDGGGSGNCLTVKNASGIVITKMVFTNGGDNGVLVQGSTDIEISKCSATDNGETRRFLGSGVRVETSSDVTVEKSKFVDNHYGGILLFDPGGNTVIDCTIEKNTCIGGQAGIDVQGSGHTVRKNKVSGEPLFGIFLGANSANILVEKNLVKKATDYGLLVSNSSGHTFTKNKYLKCEELNVEGDDMTMDGEKILRSDGVALNFNASNSTLRKLKVLGSASHGINILGPNNLIEDCKVFQCRDGAAFRTSRKGTGNTFRRNVAKRNRSRDLDDNAGIGQNTYENNKFDPDKISPEGLEF